MPFKTLQVEVCARPNAFDQLEWANSLAVDIQDWFGHYQNVPYPLSKMSESHVIMVGLNRHEYLRFFLFSTRGTSRLRSGRHGELGTVHVPRNRAAVRRADVIDPVEGVCGAGRVARTRTYGSITCA